ncbi:helix-turn-helix domain-containing protein [Actinoplanes sp. LDG1-06]|uniref:Helix-turn-helix domain-containing protein n=1 Tax=Paractinoplanes ovalisporus TaxID=2810368 RepID=A0ABS2AB54_9ACTN|nr:helix-turn-helix transcriptional regulator [Actinoplanes ovalisporus]MBM2617038.1 helix-turn-helix domain-containing protein [Actinoplanes ovalisporus]
MSEGNLIGDFLRARRALVSPEEAGLRPQGIRRVAGLRREEVALLAGISSDYYLRLEQGRDRHPSVPVLESLARVLRLDEESADYLIGLATPKPARSKRPRREVVPSGVRQLLEVLGLPAFVEGRYFDVLAANPLAEALSPCLRVGRNRLRDVFLDPAERALFPDWETATVRLVAGFRESVGDHTDDPRYVHLVDELSQSSEKFRQLWARHDVHTREGEPTRIEHPQVGEMTVRREKLAIGGAKSQMLVVYHAKPDTPSGDKLTLLGHLPPTTGTSMVVHDQGSKGRP